VKKKRTSTKANKLIPLTGGENILIQQNETEAHNPEARLTCLLDVLLSIFTVLN
jgi:hypothetical protein